MYNPFARAEKNSLNNKTEAKKMESAIMKTPESLRKFGDMAISMFCKNFSVEGMNNIKRAKEANPETKFIISSSHTHNLDVPAALKALGEEFNIQVTGESLLLEQLKYIDKRALINLVWGRENFTALDYKDDSVNGKRGLFNPDNFSELEDKMKAGKTPWMASQPFSKEGKIGVASIGSVYLAAKTEAAIIPTALETIGGGSSNLEGPLENVKGLVKRSDFIYHVGTPLEFPALDVSIIDKVFVKRRNNEAVSQDEMNEFKNVHEQLKKRASLLAENISNLLAPEKEE